ncbi:MFS transporter [Alicyclobacillus vulcanalis]|uniref:MFS transporter, FHS family, glucose/mannose:H+ symporter n=1 Tax=Alicyclobacillus vulcanalis TaxID=252246 RepID=A0A1N7LKD4_9BACL|nr:MFS transporter [Alicyclobacillus vulcanalis]SIS74298.1 MFS transporter, FHS family, glucose/mannose:H+ symporter [Alicyclobacillus vulcanalis]
MPAYVWLACGLYLMNGMATVVFGAVMPIALHSLHRSYVFGSDLVFLQFVGYWIGVPLSAWIVRRLGYRTAIWVSSLSTGLAQAGLALWLRPGPYLACSLVSGAGMALMQATVSTSLIEWFPSRRAVIMSRTEAAFGLGCVLSPLGASVCIAHGAWRASFAFVAAAALALALVSAFTPMQATDHPGGPKDAHTDAIHLTGRRDGALVFALFMVCILVYVGVESCVNNFLPAVFVQHFGVSATAASVTVSTFWAAMVVGRMATGWIARVLPYRPYLLLASLGTLATLVAMVVTRSHAVGYVECFLLGIFMSGMYVVTLVFANHAFPTLTGLVTRWVTFFAGLGGATLPYAFGWVMAKTGSQAADVCLALFAALLFAVVAFTGVVTKRKSPSRPGVRAAG